MEYAAHEAFLDSHVRDSKGKSMGTQRENLMVAARGSLPAVKARALKALEGKRLPSSVAHLYDWAKVLHGRSGIGEHGLAPLTPTTIKHMGDLMDDIDPLPHEVEVLFWLDAIMLNPPKGLA